MKIKTRRYYIYYFAKIGVFLLGIIPLRMSLFIAECMGKIAYRVLKKYREITVENLNNVFGKDSGFDVQKIAEKVTEEAVEKAIEESIEGEEGGEADVEIDEEGISIKTDEGEMTIGTGAELPDGFPGVVPVYPDMEIITSWRSVDDGKENFSVSGISSDPGEKIFDWYKSKLSGWDIDSEFSSEQDNEMMYSLNTNNGTYNVSVLIIESEDEITVVLNVNEM